MPAEIPIGNTRGPHEIDQTVDDMEPNTFKWVIDKEATAAGKDSKHEECSVCSYKKSAVEIPATGFRNGSARQPTKPGNTSSPQTGDNSRLAL